MLGFWLGLGLATAGPPRLTVAPELGTAVGVSVAGSKNAEWLERLAAGSWMSQKGSTRLLLGSDVLVAHDAWTQRLEAVLQRLPSRPDLTVGLKITRVRLFTSESATYSVVDGEWTVEAGWAPVAQGRLTGQVLADLVHPDPLGAALQDGLDRMAAATGFSTAWHDTPTTAPADLRPIVLRACAAPAASLEAAVDATVVVKTEAHIGAGTLVSPDGYVITADHVVADARKLTVRFHDGTEAPATVVRHRKAADVALLHVERSQTACAKPTAALPRIASDLYAIGTPTLEALAFSVSKGIVSGLREDGDLHLVQTDTAVSPGYSGGPLVDPKGAWVGVLSFKIVSRHAEGLTFAVQAADALKALDITMGTKTVLPTEP